MAVIAAQRVVPKKKKKKNDYYPYFWKFMGWMQGHGFDHYPRTTPLFSHQDRLSITPEHVLRYFCLITCGKEKITEDNRPTLLREGSVQYVKKAISFYMPHSSEWNVQAGFGHPTKSKLMLKFLSRGLCAPHWSSDETNRQWSLQVVAIKQVLMQLRGGAQLSFNWSPRFDSWCHPFQFSLWCPKPSTTPTHQVRKEGKPSQVKRDLTVKEFKMASELLEGDGWEQSGALRWRCSLLWLEEAMMFTTRSLEDCGGIHGSILPWKRTWTGARMCQRKGIIHCRY